MSCKDLYKVKKMYSLVSMSCEEENIYNFIFQGK